MSKIKIRLVSNDGNKFVGLGLAERKFLTGTIKDLESKYEIVTGHSVITDGLNTMLNGVCILREIAPVDGFMVDTKLAELMNPYYDKIVKEATVSTLIDADYIKTGNVLMVSVVRVMGNPRSGITMLLLSNVLDMESISENQKELGKLRKALEKHLANKMANNFPNAKIHVETSQVESLSESKQKLLGLSITTTNDVTYLVVNKHVQGLF